MEATSIRLRGENVDRFAGAFLESKSAESERSLNKRGVRNIHRYGGDGFTHVAYERGSAHESSWLLVSVLVERVDDRTATVVVFVGGGGEGPFKLEELTVTRILEGEAAVGQAGRFATVIEDIHDVCESLDVEAETIWESDTESSLIRRLTRKILDS